MVKKWCEVPIKEKIQYWTAIVLLFSGVLMAFLSFFMTTNNEVNDSVLIYFSQTLIFAGGIFGVSLYFKSQLGEFKTKSKQYIDKKLNASGSTNDDA